MIEYFMSVEHFIIIINNNKKLQSNGLAGIQIVRTKTKIL
jgi:hypothetical protein